MALNLCTSYFYIRLDDKKRNNYDFKREDSLVSPAATGS